MSDTILGAIIGVGGTVVGILISFMCQLLISKYQDRKENRRATYQLKIDTYSDAIRYISLCCRQYANKDNDSYNELVFEADRLYSKFHPVFSIIAPKTVIEQFNSLRNAADNGSIKAPEAYKRVIEILDFNISNDIS